MNPLMRALGRHRLPVALVVLEVALACGVVTNTLHLLGGYLDRLRIRPGIDPQVAWVKSSGAAGAAAAADLDALRRSGDVLDAAAVNTLPLTGTAAYTFGVSADSPEGRGETPAGLFFWGPHAADTLGIRLVAGRDFRMDEYADYSLFGTKPPPHTAWITHALARRLFGDGDPLSRRIRLGLPDEPMLTVVGVIDRLLPPAPHFTAVDGYDIVLPVRQPAGALYALRLRNGPPAGALDRVRQLLYARDPGRVIARVERFAETRNRFLRGARSMSWTLSALSACLIALAAVGIVAISHYWVLQRQRSIAIRRALGAPRQAIIGYFLAENAVLVAGGSLLGVIVAIGLNLAMVRWFEVSPLSWSWLAGGAALLLLMGQAAALSPALRASSVEPALISGAD